MDRINRIRKGSFIPQTRDNEVKPDRGFRIQKVK
jgi:hypothetical protein